MLDLSKSYGRFEDVLFYGDHQDNEIIYYFPDEVHLAHKAGCEEEYDFLLQVYVDNQFRLTSDAGLNDSDGALLQLTVNCDVEPDRLRRAFIALKRTLPSIPENAVLTLPSWTDGSVELITMNASSLLRKGSSDWVDAIISPQRPSLLTGLKGVFIVRYDASAADAVYSAIKRRMGCYSLVSYDLKFTAIRPAMDLKMTAYLSRCQETAKKNINANVKFSLDHFKLNLSAQMAWLVQKMKENGDIVIEGRTEADSPEEQRLLDELMNDFTDQVLRELFTPSLFKENYMSAFADALSEAIADLAPIRFDLCYKLTDKTFSDTRTIFADYSERCAVTRTHNPQTVMSGYFDTLADNFEDYVKLLKTENLYKRQEVVVRLSYDFDKPDNDLECVEVLIWQQKAGLLENVPANGFAIPNGVSPMGKVTFSAQEQEECRLYWECVKAADKAYYYQMRFTYSGELDHIYSPREIVTPPMMSDDREISVNPSYYMFYRNIPVTVGELDFDVFSKVNVNLEIRDAAGKCLEIEAFELNEGCVKSRYIVRDKNLDGPDLWLSKIFYFKDKDMPVLKYPPVRLQGNAVLVDDPRTTQEVHVSLLGNNDDVEELAVTCTVKSPVANRDESIKKQINLAEDSTLDEMVIKLTRFSPEDTVTYVVTKKLKGEKRQQRSPRSEPVLLSQLDTIEIDLDT